MLNQIIAQSLPFLPKKFVWLFSKRYVAGERIDDGIAVSKQLNRESTLVTVDLLGEFITTMEQATENKNDYIKIINRFSTEAIIGNFSLKPSSFGLLIDEEACYKLIHEVVARIDAVDSFLRIDMEDSQCTNLEIRLYTKLKAAFPKRVGLVLQSYMRRTENDIRSLIQTNHSAESPLNFRLCKGIYIEPEDIAFRDYDEVRSHYLNNLKIIFENGIYVGIATHDKYLVNEAMKLITSLNISKDKYEFQMLYGVTPSLRAHIIAAGHTMRVYVPFGKDWFGYCSRRIKENPKMATDIIKALFMRG